METKIELERKWLLKRCPDWVQENAMSDVFIDQFYTEDGWRYRKTEPVTSGKAKYEKCKKVNIERGINHEIDYQKIKKKEYEEAYKDAVKKIGKNRMTIEHEGTLIEVDAFNDADLVIVEVEGITMYDTVVFPEEIEKNILMEVTGHPKFSNFDLADDITEEDEDEEGDHDNDDDDDNDDDND